jgi:dGTPase
MNWEKLICDKRLGLEAYHKGKQTRNDFQRDYDRMVFSSPFRRLQNKTQVFPLPGSIFVHNRLTHSLEVSSVGRSLANEVAISLREKYGIDAHWTNYLGDIVAAACLCHDIGNPPFGHSGERTIGSFFEENDWLQQRIKPILSEQQWQDFIHFEGNANSFRLLTHQFCGRRNGGFAMTYSTLASIVKYPFSSLHAGKKGKFGFFTSEESIYRKIADELEIPEKDGVFARHPLVYIVEAADDICYQIMDIEDAHKLHVLPTKDVVDLFSNYFAPEERAKRIEKLNVVTDPNEQVAFMRSMVIGELVKSAANEFIEHEEEILNGNYTGSLVENCKGYVAPAYKMCSDLAWKRIYRAPLVVDVEIAGNRIITYLMNALLNAVLNPERTSSKMLLAKMPEQYNAKADDIYERVQSVLDHVSAMTDVYALDLFRKLNGHSLPAV